MTDKIQNERLQALHMRRVYEIPYTRQIEGLIRIKASSADEAYYLAECMYSSDFVLHVGEIKEV